MKTKWLILLFMTGMTACSPKGEKDTPPTTPVTFRLGATVKQYAGTSVSLPDHTETGLFISRTSQPISAAEHFNLKFTTVKTGELYPPEPIPLTENENYTIYAYAPYQETITDPEAILFQFGTDVLGCPVPAQIREVSAPQYTGNLEFVHCTAQIRFIVQIRDEATLGKLSATSVLKATGFLPQGRLNASDGSLDGEGEPSELTAIKAAATQNEPEDEYSLESAPVCYFTRQDVSQTIGLRVTHGGVTRTGSITQLFRPGESYTFTIYVGEQEELSMKATLTPWIDVNETIEFE